MGSSARRACIARSARRRRDTARWPRWAIASAALAGRMAPVVASLSRTPPPLGGACPGAALSAGLLLGRRRGGRCRRSSRACRTRGQQGQQQAGGEKRRRQARRHAGEEICGAAARHEAAAAADAERAALGALQQDDADQRRGDHEVKDEQDGGHSGSLSGRGLGAHSPALLHQPWPGRQSVGSWRPLELQFARARRSGGSLDWGRGSGRAGGAR